MKNKITKKQLTELEDNEGQMAKSQLERSMEYAKMIYDFMDNYGGDSDKLQFPSWVQSKLTKSMDYLQSVYNYLDGKDGLADNPAELRKKQNAAKNEGKITEAKIKKGSIVIPNKGPHKGEKHEVIHDFGNGTYNIKPTGMRNKYRLGAAGASAGDLKLVKENKKPIKDYEKSIEKIITQLKGASKLHGGQADKIEKIVTQLRGASKLHGGQAEKLIDMLKKANETKDVEDVDVKELKVLLRDLIQKEMTERGGAAVKAPSAYGYAEDAEAKINGSDVAESTESWEKALKDMHRQKIMSKLSKKDKETLLKIQQLMAKEKKVKEVNEAKKYPTVSNKFKNALDRLPEKHFHRKGVKALIKKLKEKDPEAAMAYTMDAFGWMKNMKEASMASHPVVKQGFAIGSASNVGAGEMAKASGVSEDDEDIEKVKEIVKTELKKSGLEDDYNVLDIVTALGLENTNESKFIKTVREEINKQLEI